MTWRECELPGQVLNIFVWITFACCVCGAASSAYAWHQHGGLRGIGSLLLVIVFMIECCGVLKRKSSARRNLLSYLWVVFLWGCLCYKTRRWFPLLCKFGPYDCLFYYTILWVKNAFKETDYRGNDCSKPKMFCQSEQTPLVPQGYLMDFCERSEYSNCAGGKNSWQSVCCPGCKRPLTRHLEYAGIGTAEANCNAGYNGFLLLHAKNSDRK